LQHNRSKSGHRAEFSPCRTALIARFLVA